VHVGRKRGGDTYGAGEPEEGGEGLEETPFLFFHSSMCFALASASLAYSSGIFLPWCA